MTTTSQDVDHRRAADPGGAELSQLAEDAGVTSAGLPRQLQHLALARRRGAIGAGDLSPAGSTIPGPNSPSSLQNSSPRLSEASLSGSLGPTRSVMPIAGATALSPSRRGIDRSDVV